MGLKLPGAGKCTATTPNELEKVYRHHTVPGAPSITLSTTGAKEDLICQRAQISI